MVVRFGDFEHPQNGHEVPEDGPWDMAVVTFDVPVRKPPVDREEAVRVGGLIPVARPAGAE